ncbi:MAG: MFS transporter [Anaerolineae bacterium]|nr:MFS transporter [Anaerolineae bacterium]
MVAHGASDRHFTRWQRRIFAIAWLSYASFYLCRVNLAVALPAIEGDLGWDARAAGLVGGAFLWVYAVGQLVNGALGQRANARWFVGAGMLASALCNAAFGAASSLWLMALLWGLNGWAQSMGWGPIIKTIRAWFGPNRRGRISALFSPCFVLGHFTAWAAGGWLVGARGWRSAFWVPALVFGAMGVAWFAAIREAPHAAGFAAPAHASARKTAGVRATVRALLAEPQLRWAASICVFASMIKDGLTLWAPTFLVDAWHMSLEGAALAASVIPLVGLGGSALAGWASDRLFHSREMPGVALLSLVVGAAMVAFLVLLGGGRTVWPVVVVLGVCGAAAYGLNSLMLTSLPLSFEDAGAAAGFLDFSSYVGGGISALAVGQILARGSWRTVFAYWMAATLLALLAAALASHRTRETRQARAV